MFVMAVTMPVKCYGGLTEKKTGSQWLMIPASKLEKFLSMVLITAVFIPMIAFCVSLGLDALLCAVDHTCGSSLISAFISADQKINSIISLSLSFLLGAIFFKSSKTVKTFLVLFAIGTVTMTVLFTILFNGVNVTELVENESLANEIVGNGPFGGDDLVPALCCIVSYVLLLTGIFFRIKTLKH